jgi:hypothetical protein
MTTLEITFKQTGDHTNQHHGHLVMNGTNDLELYLDTMRAVALCLGFTPHVVARITYAEPLEGFQE